MTSKDSDGEMKDISVKEISITQPTAPAPIITHEDSESVPSMEDIDLDSVRGQRRRRFGWAFFLWASTILILVGLKQSGMVEKEFERLDDLLTHIQIQIPQISLPHIDVKVPQELNNTLQQSYKYWAQIEESVIDHLLPTTSIRLPQLNETLQQSYKYWSQEKSRPGFQMAEKGAQAHYPVVLIPGFTTSGLEVWRGKECAKKYFRVRLWAAITGASTFFLERECWREHMMLDPYTGGDPEGIRLRASEGVGAADYFLGPWIWIWGKIIENLADVGYTPSDMAMEPYDWRVAFPILEERDGYLTNLKARVESLHKTTGKKVVLTAHSMGALLVHHFFGWVTTPENKGGGGGGKDWVDKHIHAYVSIAGSHLGVPKAATAILSGEMSNTVMLGRVGQVVEQFFGRRWRRDLWATWGSLWAMLPKGGDLLWGAGADMCTEKSADDPFCTDSKVKPLIVTSGADEIQDKDANATDQEDSEEEESSFSANPFDFFSWATSPTDDKLTQQDLNETMTAFLNRTSHTASELVDFLSLYGGGYGPKVASPKTLSLQGEENPSSRTWHDPTRTPLPHAPKMKIYCVYGRGIDTERGYVYRRWQSEQGYDEESLPYSSKPPLVLDTSYTNESLNIRHGVRYSDGDASVPLISLSYMCTDAWRRADSGLNPSNSTVYTREYTHVSEFNVEDPIRGGPLSGDHVEILGNENMLYDLIRVVTDFEQDELNRDQISSNIKEIAAEINAQTGGGLKLNKSWLSKILG